MGNSSFISYNGNGRCIVIAINFKKNKIMKLTFKKELSLIGIVLAPFVYLAVICKVQP